MPYTGDKLRQLECYGNDAINGDTEAAANFVALAMRELDAMAEKHEKLAAKAVSLMYHVPDGVKCGDIQDTLAAFKFWRASQSTEYWLCPCGCKSYYPIDRIVCPDSGRMRAQDLSKVKWM